MEFGIVLIIKRKQIWTERFLINTDGDAFSLFSLFSLCMYVPNLCNLVTILILSYWLQNKTYGPFSVLLSSNDTIH